MKREALSVTWKRQHAVRTVSALAVLYHRPVLTLSSRRRRHSLPRKMFVSFDTPSDGGGSLTVIWSPAPYDSAASQVSGLTQRGNHVPDPAAMKVVAEFPANQHYVRESKWPWWTRPATGDQHQFTLRNGQGRRAQGRDRLHHHGGCRAE